MFQNYLKIAVRNLLRNKAYSFINISGLSLGVACCILLTLYILDEYKVDKHHADLNNLYRITTEIKAESDFDKLATTSPPIAMAMKDEIPEITEAARIINPPGVAQNLIKYEDKLFYETNGFIADSSIFNVLTYKFIEGNPAKSLTESQTIVLADNLKQKLFGNESALNKIISISQGGESRDFKVTGVFVQDNNSHIQANFFTSILSDGIGAYLRSEQAQGEWAGQNFIPAYIKLVEGHDKDAVIKKMNEVLVKYGAEDMKALGMTKTLGLEPVKDIYLKSGIGRSPRITYIYVIASIATFILLIACINFMNLSTAKATHRASEIGIRKVMGALRSSLITQILGEAMAIVILSILLSVVITQVALPAFNELTGKSISFNSISIFSTTLVLFTLTLITGLLAGSYPAFYLSSFQPIQVLKGKLNLNNASGWLRQSLVVFQFMIAITLVCGMLIISKQLNFMQEKDLGFNAESKIVLPLRTAYARQQYETLKKELTRQELATNISAAEYIPGSTIWNDMVYYPEGGDMNNAILNRRNSVDYGYLEMMGIKMIAGRTFTDNRAMDSQQKVIINQTSAEKFGFSPEKAVGQKIYFDWQGQNYSFEIIGVMADYHQNSLKEKINPIIFEMSAEPTQYGHLVAAIQTKNFTHTVSRIESTWKGLVQDTPFEYSFLDESVQKQYDEDKKVSAIINTFTFMAMFISSLGLYGLSTYMTERRFKEIGVRKVLGANVGQIIGLMSKEFLKLVLIAFIISVPLGWYCMNKWLDSFAYKINISLDVFLSAGSAAIIIALLTVSFESFKAASTNPVKALRNE